MVRLRRIPAIRAANVLTLTIAIPYGILLLAWTILLALFLLPAASSGETSPFLGALVGISAAWGAAIVFLWIVIAATCASYNLIAGNLGGIELEFRTIPPDS